MLEKDVEKALRLHCKKQGVICYKFTSPGHTGVPDRILIFPDGGIVFVEVKAPEKVPTGNQIREIKRLKEQGAEVFVIDTPAGCRALVDAKLSYGDLLDPVWGYYSEPSLIEGLF